MAETSAFLIFAEIRLRQNLQFWGNMVDKVSEMDYIVKSKTNGDWKYVQTSFGLGSICYKNFTTHTIIKIFIF